MTDILDLDFSATPTPPPSGRLERFYDRWHLVGAGLSNVWRYGDLNLPAPSGRLLLRGPNGTGKTTALEALWPYLLDLDQRKLVAGKARTTTLKQLMSEGHPAKGRRYGYVWLTFAPPLADETTTVAVDESAIGIVSYGVRLQFAPNSTPAVRVIPFTVPGRPLHDLALRGPGGTALEHEEFCQRVDATGGHVFTEPEEYVEHLATRVWATTATELRELAGRLREVRNPSLLGDLSPAAAADALRQSLPGVAPDVLSATAEALAESDTTRDAFARDERAAQVLAEFAKVWTGHVVDVARAAHSAALDAATEVGARSKAVDGLTTKLSTAQEQAQQANDEVDRLDAEHRDAVNTARAIEMSDAYRAHGRITDLRGKLRAEQATAAATLGELRAAAQRAETQTSNGVANLHELIDDLTQLAGEAHASGATPVVVSSLLDHSPRPRAVRSVNEHTVDPGAGVNVVKNDQALGALAADWTQRAEHFRSMEGKARMVRLDHDNTVAPAAAKADKASTQAEAAANAADAARQEQDTATDTARTERDVVVAAVRHWAPEYPQLRGVGDDTHSEPDGVWDLDDVDELPAGEPAVVLTQVNEWANSTLRIGATRAAAHAANAAAHRAAAVELDTHAAEHRAEADNLRSGQLLPLPRPEWVLDTDDDAALGTVLEWRTDITATDDTRTVIELALGSAGLLGAHLDVDGASTAAWRVTTGAPRQTRNLAEVLTVDADHPHAATARAVLASIALADTAAGPASSLDSPTQAPLVIGLDGTFAAGPLAGNPAAALATSATGIPAASHIGARTRHERALARAAELEGLTTQLTEQAQARRASASDEQARRDAVLRQAESFPSRDALTRAEAARAQATQRAQQLAATAREEADRAEAARSKYMNVRTEWLQTARNLGVPTDADELDELVTSCAARAAELARCATQLGRLVTGRLPRVLASLPDEAVLAGELANLEAKARTADHEAAKTQALLTEAESVGDSADAVARFEEANARAQRAATALPTARQTATDAAAHCSQLDARLDNARQQLAEVRPRQLSTDTHLAGLLSWPPVAEVLGVDDPAALGRGDDLLAAAEALLERRATYTKRTLGERYDDVRAELAQTWTIARADPPTDLPELDVFELTHADAIYDPGRAAARAGELAKSAREALDTAEATALRDFVIGRLPSAIGTAWTSLMDWKTSVNHKMRAAQASSGVGVQVQIALRDEIDPMARTVYELSCDVGDAVRTDEQKAAVGRALQTLLAASDGDNMTDRLAAAVDIRDWVDVHYIVERPGPDGQMLRGRWGSRTGLSGGERRLVVLAPMLAAIAASYDRLAETGLRLVPLDEVPAEVDERGREGLARYIAELDLDVVCTSYLWDGAPGAWDGIDAHDLEAGADGTVIAFPMLVRGTAALPDDAAQPMST